MRTVLQILLLPLLALALWRRRWAYIAFIVLSLMMIPLRTGFRLVRPSCDLTPMPSQLAQSVGNVPHIVIFALLYIVSAIQFRGRNVARFMWPAVIAFGFGIVLELEQGATRTGNCDLQDLVPNTIGIIFGMILVALWQRVLPRR